MSRMLKTTLKILCGLVLGVCISVAYVKLGFPLWEEQSPDGNSYIIGWRSAVVFILLLAATQYSTFLVFRWFRIKGRVREE